MALSVYITSTSCSRGIQHDPIWCWIGLDEILHIGSSKPLGFISNQIGSGNCILALILIKSSKCIWSLIDRIETIFNILYVVLYILWRLKSLIITIWLPFRSDIVHLILGHQNMGFPNLLRSDWDQRFWTEELGGRGGFWQWGSPHRRSVLPDLPQSGSWVRWIHWTDFRLRQRRCRGDVRGGLRRDGGRDAERKTHC